MEKGRFIAIEGLDGAGKSTQITLLEAWFKSKGKSTRFIHFPRHNTGVYGQLISKFLRGEFGSLEAVHPQLVALLFAQDRLDFAPQLQQWLDEGAVVLVDRYVLSNVAFQCAKLPDAIPQAELADWIYHFEFEYNKIPKPDLSIYLDVPFSFTRDALGKRKAGEEREYLEGKQDIHEEDLDFQAAVRHQYDLLASAHEDVHRLVCATPEGNMKPVEVIHAAITSLIHDLNAF
jgi:dTMP kinase